MKKVKLVILSLFSLSLAQTASAQQWAVAVNAADMVSLGTISAEGSVSVGQHATINAVAKVNPWTFNKNRPEQFQSRQQTYSIGARWWPWNVYSGWWMAGRAQYQQYNRGGLRVLEVMNGRSRVGARDDEMLNQVRHDEMLNQVQHDGGSRVEPGMTEEGDAYGLSLGAGYSLMLGKHVNIDFGLEVWGGRTIYTVYACPTCGKVTESGKKWFFLPNDLVLSFQWVF